MKFRFIFTTSIISPEREQLYLERITKTIQQLQHLPFVFYILENNGIRETELNSIQNVTLLYTNTNKIDAFSDRKGIKEFSDIMFLSEKYMFDDNDLIIKFTGLYTLNDTSFLDLVYSLESNYDAFIKWFNICTNKYLYDDCILGLFALRYKYLKEFNYMEMLSHPSMEHVFARYIRETVISDRIKDITHLGMCYRGETSVVF
jgi:hypothetical protein